MLHTLHKTALPSLLLSRNTHTYTFIYVYLFFNHKLTLKANIFSNNRPFFTSLLNPGIKRQSHSVSSRHPVSVIPHATNSTPDSQAWQWL